MNARLIQEQVPLESQVKFSLQGGGDISGKLVEIGRGHIKIEVKENQSPAVIPIERVIYWQSLTETSQNGQSEDPVPASSDTSTAEDKPKADQSEKSKVNVLSSAEIEIEKKLIEIETRFQAKCQSAKIELKEPDFKFPEEDLKDLSDRQRKEATNIWNRIRDKYQYAKKNNELSATFGRIQPIITDLKDLANRYRSSASIKRHLAYFYTLSGNQEEALKNYRETAIFSQNEIDWYNLAVVAQKTENKELACYSLGQVFQRLPITDDIEAWYLYVHLLIEFNSHRELSQICQTQHQKISQEETSLLLETGVYLLKVADRETTAKEALKKAIAGEISISSLEKTLNALDLQPTENYQSVVEEISRQMDAKEVSQAVEDQPPQGHIYSYKSHQGYGFLRDRKGTEYFFHISAIIDPVLREELTYFSDDPIPVSFQATQGSKGPNATQIFRYKEELYVTSKPQLTLRLPVESYAPDTNGKIEVQIVIENEKGRSPAEALELVIKGDQAFFTVTADIKRDESLRGGESSILKVPLRVTRKALDSQTFSFPIYARYRTRADEQEETQVENLSIRLYPQDDFETIKNPYAAYAEGGIVGDPAMFFGRDELIQNIAQTIQESRLQSKCVMVFGQKRSGKSSVLYHLKTLLQKDKELLILDLGNIGTIQDPDSEVPLLYQVLKRILTELEYAIEDRSDDGFSSLDLSIPDDLDFYDHPAPLQCFQDTFKTLNRLVSRQENWRGVRVVLLIDEFQYIYGRIVAGEIHEAFMQNWKALLQANYFSAVLVGQDVMPKFKERFPNEFGTTQDERVTYLNKQDATKLIEDPIRIGGRQGESRYREQAIERILDLTAGSPFYIQILCNRLVEYMNLKHAGLVTEADVEQIKNELIQGVNAFGLDKFDNLINSGDTLADAISDDDALKVLKAIAVNSRTGPCHRDKIDCETCLRVDKILDDLVKRDVVKHDEGQYYQIQVVLFKEWLVVNG